MRTLYFDCFCGASGDMILGALIDAGVPFEVVRDELAKLGVGGYRLSAEKVNKHGIMATQFDVHVEGHGHGHGHSHEHHHDHGHGYGHSHEGGHEPHRHLKDIVGLIEGSPLSEGVKRASIATFRRIGECEAEVHGTTVEKIHFHEVGAVDSIVDIVGAHIALEVLKPERILASALHVGSGTVRCAHGVMPVPAPATALLLKDAPSYGGTVEGELVTPTGAALITQLAEGFGPQPSMTIGAVGMGSGTKDLPDRPNVLRVLIGEGVVAEGVVAEGLGGGRRTERIAVIETNIDDMSSELLAALMEDLLRAGARDVFFSPVYMKKGRPGHLVTALADVDRAGEVSDALFAGSTTFGVRMRVEERICLERTWKSVETPWGAVRVKVGALNGTVQNASPEYEDCARAAASGGVAVRKVYEAALAAAVKGEWIDG